MRKLLILFLIISFHNTNAQTIHQNGKVLSVQLFNQEYFNFNINDCISAQEITTTSKFEYGNERYKEKSQQIWTQKKSLSYEVIKDTIYLQTELINDEQSLFALIKIYCVDNHILKLEAQTTKECNRLIFKFNSTETEHIYGGGIQNSHFDLKGVNLPIMVNEQGIGRGDQPTTKWLNLAHAAGNDVTSYAPMATFITTKNRGFLSLDKSNLEFDFTNDDEIKATVWNNKLSIQFFKAATPILLLEQMTEITGRPKQLPYWAFGTWLGIQGGKSKVNKTLQELKQKEAKIDAIWIQDWVGRRKTRFGSQLWWDWKADTTAYPNLPQYIDSLKKEKIYTLGYLNSFLSINGETAKKAIKADVLLKNKDGNIQLKTPGFPTYLVDLYHKDGMDWMQKTIQQTVEKYGFSGWMSDYGEWYPVEKNDEEEIISTEKRNLYPILWAKANELAIQEFKNDSIVYFSRSGFLESSKHTSVFWQGDQMVDWGKHDGLKSTMCGMLSASMSGIAISHSDVGGYTNIKIPIFLSVKREEELLKRWIELNAFTPIFRTHEGLQPKNNVQVYDEEIIDFYAKFSQIRAKIQPYLYQLSKEAAQKGIPMARPLYLHYPEDENVYNLTNQFLLGEYILVAPILDKNKTERTVYFPEGEWKHWFTKEKITGPIEMKINCPIGTPAIFVKEEYDF